MNISNTSLQKLPSLSRPALLNPSQTIKISNLPKNYEPSILTSLFQKISKIRCYNKTADHLWIRFQNIRDRKTCLILDGYAINTKRIQIHLDFKEEEIPVTTWAAMHGIAPEEKYKLSFRNLVVAGENSSEERKGIGKTKESGGITKMEPEVEGMMREIFSVKYVYLMVLLYLLSIVLTKMFEIFD